MDSLELVKLSPASEEEILDDVCRILCEYWGGSRKSRKRQITERGQSYALVGSSASQSKPGGVLQRKTYGHANIIPCSTASGDVFGNCLCGVVSSVIVSGECRGGGYGQILMKLLESTAREEGYCYLYLWTNDAVHFYEKVGYSACERLAESVSVFRSMNTGSVSKLENLFIKKAAVLIGNASFGESVSVDGDGDGSQLNNERAEGKEEQQEADHTQKSISLPTVYMRKRIKDTLPLEDIPLSEWQQFIVDSLSPSVCIDSIVAKNNSANISPTSNLTASLNSRQQLQPPQQQQQEKSLLLTVHVNPIPWSRQIGPSCGIQALRMAASGCKRLRGLRLVQLQRVHIEESESISSSGTRLETYCYCSSSVPATNAAITHTTNITTSTSNSAAFLPYLLNDNSKQRCVSLLQNAIDLGISSEGELFHIDHVAELACSIGMEATVQNVADLGFDTFKALLRGDMSAVTSCSCISDRMRASIECRTRGAFIILPYDKAGTAGGGPCFAGGSRAHYGVVCGYGELGCEKEMGDEEVARVDHKESCSPMARFSISVPFVSTWQPRSKCMSELSKVSAADKKYDCRVNCSSSSSNNYISGSSSCGTKNCASSHQYLVVLQGMSRRPIVYPFSDWCASNSQLFSDTESEIETNTSVIGNLEQQNHSGCTETSALNDAIAGSSNDTARSSNSLVAILRNQKRWVVPPQGPTLGGKCVIVW